MLIVTQDRETIVNLDSIVCIDREEVTLIDHKCIRYFAESKVEQLVLLGEYKDTPEHENLIEKIAQCAGAINVFYMPEEE